MLIKTASYSRDINQTIPENCPLCGDTTQNCIFEEKKRYCRPFFQCDTCHLIFVPKSHHLTPEKEKARYDLHNNNPNDEGYIKFLSKLADPVKKKISPRSSGINFGSGPDSILSELVKIDGHSVKNYDPYYANDKSVLEGQYDFLISSEVVEHFSTPIRDWELMDGLIRNGGLSGIMTQLYRPEIDFAKWWYKNDETHIAFYSRDTFDWIGKRFGYKVETQGESIILLWKL